jgi:hypothetical protein
LSGGILGRTISSFRIALAEEEVEWKDYRRHLGKRERKAFDEMFAMVRLCVSTAQMQSI